MENKQQLLQNFLFPVYPYIKNNIKHFYLIKSVGNTLHVTLISAIEHGFRLYFSFKQIQYQSYKHVCLELCTES